MMWAKRVKELMASWLVGHGVLLLIAPRQRALLWLFGPEGLRKLTLWYANHPTVMRLRGIGAIAIGIWLALRQYQETPRPWYQRWFSQYRLVAGPWLAPLGLVAILLAALAVIYRRSRGEGSTVEGQAREEMRRIIRESVERSRRQR